MTNAASRFRRITSRVLAFTVLVASVSTVALAQQPTGDAPLVGEDISRPAERMSVFSTPDQGLATRLDPMTRRSIEGASAFPSITELDMSSLRQSLTYRRLGQTVVVYVAASANQQACIFTRHQAAPRHGGSGGSGSCGGALRFNGHVSVGTSHNVRSGTFVIGLADDAVRQVRVQLSNGRTVRATLNRNAYLLHVPQANLRTRGLLVDLKDGRTLDVTMGGCLRSQVVPAPASRLGCGFGMNQGPASTTA